MFENILGQTAVRQIMADIENDRLAPSMLFWGPFASGKGTAALELARALSCERALPGPRGAWNCPCRSCALHRLLSHPDLLMLGCRSFQAEIAAAAAAFAGEPAMKSAGVFFVRSARKLTARFSPALWEDDPKFSRLNPLLLSLEDALEEVEKIIAGGDVPDERGIASLEKLRETIVKDAGRLETEGLPAAVPIAQVRRAAYWSHLAPQGRRKFILIENAGRMQEGARNSLLKILEEPPETLSVALTASSRGAILPTLLSRLRPYRFFQRDGVSEAEVLRRVFRVKEAREKKEGIKDYLDTFLPLSAEALYPLAAFFAAWALRDPAAAARSRGKEIGATLTRLEEYAAAAARRGGLEPPADNSGNGGGAVKTVLDKAENFTAPGLFSRFIAAVLRFVSDCLAQESARGGLSPAFRVFWLELWRKEASEVDTAVNVWNISAALALEKFLAAVKNSMNAW